VECKIQLELWEGHDNIVSITYGRALLDDCDVADWEEHRLNMIDADAVLYCENGDYFKIDATADSADDEYCYYQYPNAGSPLSISTTTHPFWLARWKTNVGSNGFGARIKAYYDGGWHDLLASTPQFSTDWTVNSGTITTGKTVQYVSFWADDYPDSVSSQHYVYYDFILLCKGIFPFPNINHLEFNPSPRYAQIPIPSKTTNATQNLGAESATIQIECDLDRGNWKRSGDVVDAQVFYEMAHYGFQDPWQWLDTGTEQFKVTLEDFNIRRISSGSTTHRVLELLFREYSLGNKSEETNIERFGLNL